ncbi:MAG: metal-dependent hydrolase, partial [Candidatus Dadabacteria bacterium]|nr:metal-dependent hydrolase [Candidatus Dadabacteria bacterium]NIQ15897.1 metal-dependent hydrolase [Candidatus Dadabacteria bacterium]
MKLLNNGTKISYIGHSTFKISSLKEKTIIVDPWIYGNPSCPEKFKEFEEIDIIAITHGHFDHMSDAINLAVEHGSKIVANWEICGWLEKNGVKNCFPMNKGGSQKIDGIDFIMTHAQHSSGIKDDYGNIIYGGEPAGFIIIMENDFRIYHAGDTNLFSDMKLISELYKPE